MVSAVHTVKRSMFGGYRNVRLATTLLKDEESARDNDVLVCNYVKYSPIKQVFTDRLRNKPSLIWLLTTPPHLKYVATLPCNLSLITCFSAFMFHKVVWKHMQGAMGFLITNLLQIYQGIFQWKKFVNRLRFDRIIAMSLWPHFLTHPVVLMVSWPQSPHPCCSTPDDGVVWRDA